ncbi:MAG: thioredoxin-like domain-containing protein [Terriglobales bacterium]
MTAVFTSWLRGNSLWLLLSTLLISPGIAYGQHAVDLDGRPLNPLQADHSKIVVLVFLRQDCPISSRYAPTIQQISKRYADSASFWLVFPDKTESAGTIHKYLQDYGYQLPVLRDPEHELVKLSHVQVTPEAAVFDRNHQLIYDGRIDDWYRYPGGSRPAPTTHDLDDAIRAAIAGKTVERNEVRGVGCFISDLD